MGRYTARTPSSPRGASASIPAGPGANWLMGSCPSIKCRLAFSAIVTKPRASRTGRRAATSWAVMRTNTDEALALLGITSIGKAARKVAGAAVPLLPVAAAGLVA